MHKDDMDQDDWERYVINRAVHFQSHPIRQELVDLAIELAGEETWNGKAWDDDGEVDNYWLRDPEA